MFLTLSKFLTAYHNKLNRDWYDELFLELLINEMLHTIQYEYRNDRHNQCPNISVVYLLTNRDYVLKKQNLAKKTSSSQLIQQYLHRSAQTEC